MPTVTNDFSVGAPIEDTWNFFMTPGDVAPCVPGCSSYEEIEADVFEADIDVSVAYTDLVFEATIEISDKNPPNSAFIEAEASPAGRMPGSATVDADLELEDGDGGTDGSVEIDFAIRGRLGSLGESAFKHQCEELTQEFIDNVTAELEGAEQVT